MKAILALSLLLSAATNSFAGSIIDCKAQRETLNSNGSTHVEHLQVTLGSDGYLFIKSNEMNYSGLIKYIQKINDRDFGLYKSILMLVQGKMNLRPKSEPIPFKPLITGQRNGFQYFRFFSPNQSPLDFKNADSDYGLVEMNYSSGSPEYFLYDKDFALIGRCE